MFVLGCFWLGASLMVLFQQPGGLEVCTKPFWQLQPSDNEFINTVVTLFWYTVNICCSLLTWHDVIWGKQIFLWAFVEVVLPWKWVDYCVSCSVRDWGGDVGGKGVNKFSSAVFQKLSLSDSRQSSCNAKFTKSFTVCFKVHCSNCNSVESLPRTDSKLRTDIHDRSKPRRWPGGKCMWGHQGLLQRSRREENVIEHHWGSVHKNWVLLMGDRADPACLGCQKSYKWKEDGKDQRVRRETLGVGWWFQRTSLKRLGGPCVCCRGGEGGCSRGMQEIQCMESDGGRGGSSCIRAFLEEVRKKCKESGGKGILIIESRGGQPRVQHLSRKNVKKACCRNV